MCTVTVRAGGILAVCTCLAVTAIVLAAADSEPGKTDPDSRPAAVAAEVALLAEVQVEIAWLADPVTFPYPLGARVCNGQLVVGGAVPHEDTRRRALALAEEHGSLPIVDRIKVSPVPALASKPVTRDSLCQAAAAELQKSFSRHVAHIEVSTQDEGYIVLEGKVPSYEEKRAISRRLARLNGCKAVLNDLAVETVASDGTAFQVVSADGKLKVPEQPRKPRAPLPTPAVADAEPAPKPQGLPATAPVHAPPKKPETPFRLFGRGRSTVRSTYERPAPVSPISSVLPARSTEVTEGPTLPPAIGPMGAAPAVARTAEPVMPPPDRPALVAPSKPVPALSTAAAVPASPVVRSAPLGQTMPTSPAVVQARPAPTPSSGPVATRAPAPVSPYGAFPMQPPTTTNAPTPGSPSLAAARPTTPAGHLAAPPRPPMNPVARGPYAAGIEPVRQMLYQAPGTPGAPRSAPQPVRQVLYEAPAPVPVAPKPPLLPPPPVSEPAPFLPTLPTFPTTGEERPLPVVPTAETLPPVSPVVSGPTLPGVPQQLTAATAAPAPSPQPVLPTVPVAAAVSPALSPAPAVPAMPGPQSIIVEAPRPGPIQRAFAHFRSPAPVQAIPASSPVVVAPKPPTSSPAPVVVAPKPPASSPAPVAVAPKPPSPAAVNTGPIQQVAAVSTMPQPMSPPQPVPAAKPRSLPMGDTVPASQTTAAPLPAPVLHYLEQRIERTCSGQAQEVRVVARSKQELTVSLKVPKRYDREKVGMRVLQLPELQPYAVQLEVEELP